MDNIDGKMYLVIKGMYAENKSCLKLNEFLTDWFDIICGVRQGDNLSPTLFAYLINSLALAIMNLGIGVALGNDKVSILLYADDMVLIGKNERELQTMLNCACMYDWSKQWRLKVNTDKTKIIHFRPTRQSVTRYNFNYGGSAVECVKYYKYLGVCVDEFLKYDKCSVILAESASRALGGIIAKFKKFKDCGYNTFTRLFNTGVLSILNYGAEVWGFGNYPKCDNVINRAMRFFLDVHRFAPTAGVVGDMGWLSL